MDIAIKDSEWQKLWHYTHAVDTEIAAWGYVKPQDDGNLYVDEVFLVPQEVSGTGVDFVSEGMPYAANKAMQDNRMGDLRFCWHSHVNMNTGFSSIDEGMIREVRDGSVMPWFVSVIFNKKGETNGRIDLFKNGISADLTAGLTHIQQIELDVRSDVEDTIPESIARDIKEFVKRKTYTNQNKGKNKGKGQSFLWTPGNQQQQQWALPAGELDHYDWGEAPSDRGDTAIIGEDIVHLTDDELLAECKAREALLKESNNGWTSTTSGDWAYWFDSTGSYVGATIIRECYNLACDLLNHEPKEWAE